MSNWIDLRMDTSALETFENLAGGVQSSSWPSPYDIPEAARAVFDGSKKLLLIQFKYINEEQIKRVEDEDGVRFGRGRNSRRLYEIAIDMDKVTEVAKQTVDDFATFLVKEIQGFANKAENQERHKNYKLVEQAISEEKQILLAEATPRAIAATADTQLI